MINDNLPVRATPLSGEEKEGLLLHHITTRDELNRWEQENINAAIEWSFSLKNPPLLTIDFALKLHKEMFGIVWKWAGTFRTSEKNIGILHWQIQPELKKLLDDVDFWIKNGSYQDKDELAARLHHRLVAIHPFPNGNGRHGRLFTELAQKHLLQAKPFTWGASSLTSSGPVRKRYIESLYEADNGNYKSLIEFARL